MDKKLNESVLV